MSRTARTTLLASLLVLIVLVLATLVAEPVVHPCPTEVEQCGRLCAGQPVGKLSWRCPRATCRCPPPIRWPRGLGR